MKLIPTLAPSTRLHSLKRRVERRLKIFRDTRDGLKRDNEEIHGEITYTTSEIDRLEQEKKELATLMASNLSTIKQISSIIGE